MSVRSGLSAAGLGPAASWTVGALAVSDIDTPSLQVQGAQAGAVQGALALECHDAANSILTFYAPSTTAGGLIAGRVSAVSYGGHADQQVLFVSEADASLHITVPMSLEGQALTGATTITGGDAGGLVLTNNTGGVDIVSTQAAATAVTLQAASGGITATTAAATGIICAGGPVRAQGGLVGPSGGAIVTAGPIALTLADSGKCFALDQTLAIAYTLPAAAAAPGATYRFVIAALGAANSTITAPAANVLGSKASGDAPFLDSIAGATAWTFVAASARQGDMVEFTSTSVYWVARGATELAAGATLA